MKKLIYSFMATCAICMFAFAGIVTAKTAVTAMVKEKPFFSSTENYSYHPGITPSFITGQKLTAIQTSRQQDYCAKTTVTQVTPQVLQSQQYQRAFFTTANMTYSANKGDGNLAVKDLKNDSSMAPAKLNKTAIKNGSSTVKKDVKTGTTGVASKNSIAEQDSPPDPDKGFTQAPKK